MVSTQSANHQALNLNPASSSRFEQSPPYNGDGQLGACAMDDCTISKIRVAHATYYGISNDHLTSKLGI